jgi:hypothetical protein
VLPPNMRVVPVPVLDDNYAYLCELLISSSCACEGLLCKALPLCPLF